MKMLVVIALVLLCFTSTAIAAVPGIEREALVALYEGTDGPNWDNNTNWLTGDPCENSWFGVTCSNNTNIVEIYLVNKISTGTILGLGQLSGPIPAELGNLINLESLVLRYNQLSGPIPAELGNLTNLKWLNLGSNQLSGSIPAELGNLANLDFLNLGSNHLSGPIPAELGNLINLSTLVLNSNQLSGPTPAELGNLINLSWLYLGSNRLSGPIPAELLNLTNLLKLVLDWNSLFTNDAGLDTFLDSRSESDWSSSQTIAPTNFRVSGGDTNSVTLAWDPIEYTANDGGYRLWYGTSPGGPYSDGGITVDKKTTSLAVAGLNLNQKHYFVVSTETNTHINNENKVVSGLSTEVIVDKFSPARATGISATDGTYPDRVRLTFNTVAGATVYRVFRCTSTEGVAVCGLPVGFPKTGVFDDRKAVPGTVYYYRVRACTKTTCGKFSVANAGHRGAAIDEILPRPTGIKATDGTFSDRVRVTFNPVAGATVYRVFRCPDNGNTCGLPIGYPKTGTFDDTKGAVGTVYYYRVRACNTTICGRFSVVNSGYSGGAGEAAPARPTGVNATDGAFQDRVSVTFNTVTGATGYQVYRCPDNTTNCGSPIGTPKTATFDDPNGIPGTVYYYRVRACTATLCGNFSAANTGYSGVILTAPENVSATDGTYGDAVLVSFDSVAGANLYQAYRCLEKRCDAVIGETGSSPYKDILKDTIGTKYYYRVRACNEAPAITYCGPGSEEAIGSLCISSGPIACPTTQAVASTTQAVAGRSIEASRVENDVANPTPFAIPMLNDMSRWILILMTLGYGLILINRASARARE